MKSLSLVFVYLVSLAYITFVRAASTLTVDCNSKIGPANHCANGALYGIIENKPADYRSLVEPLHLNTVRNPARGGNGNQHPYGDAIKVAKKLEPYGVKVSIDLADILPGWPYRWPGTQGWLNQIRSFIKDKKASGTKNWYGYEIWNEPDGTWKDSNGLNFHQLWKQTYDVIRQNDPSEKIIGPCDSYYQENRIKSFLQFAKANNCLPDIMCWHELGGIEWLSSHVKAYRNLERSLGIKELPLSINEYCDGKHEYEGQPGSSARFIGKFERYKIDTAMISWWFVPQPGRLGSLLATDTQKGAGWYFYKWYGDMTGTMVNVSPPNDNSVNVDGAACVDNQKQYVSFIFGGPNDGSINANFRNLPSFLGSTATVKVEKVDWRNKDTPSNGPNVIFEKKMQIQNGQISVNIPGTNATSGYRVYITGNGTPAPVEDEPVAPIDTSNKEIKSGETYYIINRQSEKALGIASQANGANVAQYTKSTGTDQQWTITYEGGYYKIINVAANRALDVNNNSVSNGGNVLIWSDNGHDNQRWEINSLGDGYFTLTNVNSGKNLDVEKNSLEDGGNVIQWENNGGVNQQWQIVNIKPKEEPKPNPPPSASAECSAKILQKGYKCCSKDCKIIYSDEDGTWGVENEEWCGCNATAECPYGVFAQGYNCCSKGLCSVVSEEDGIKWSVENGEWCGIIKKEDDCWSLKFGFECCQEGSPVFLEDESGKWGVTDDDQWCGIRN